MYQNPRTPEQYYQAFKYHVDTKISDYVSSLEMKNKDLTLKLEEANNKSKRNEIDFKKFTLILKENEKLNLTIEEQIKELEELQKEIRKLREDTENIIQNVTNELIKEKVIPLNGNLEEEIKRNNDLKKENERLKREIEKNKGIIKKNSHNSSKPSSTDGYTRIFNSRKTTGKSIGGQKGHIKDIVNLFDNPNEIVKLKEETCSCGGRIEYKGNIVRTQKQDIKITSIVTEYHHYQGVCPCCGKVHTNNHKKQDKMNPKSFGNYIKAFVAVLSSIGIVSVNRIQKMVSNFTDNKISISQSQITNILKEAETILKTERQNIINRLKISKILHVDETTLKYKRDFKWITILTNGKDIAFFVNDEKGHKLSQELNDILTDYKGILVHDHFKHYYSFTKCSHAECNAHVIRYLTYGEEIDKQIACKELKELLLEMYHLKKTKQPIKITAYRKIYLRIINNALKEYTHKEKEKPPFWYSLFKRLKEYVKEHLAFATKDNVPFDNNKAEAGFRFIKSKQKISGNVKNEACLNGFLSTQAFVQTYRDCNVFSLMANLF